MIADKNMSKERIKSINNIVALVIEYVAMFFSVSGTTVAEQP